MTEKNQPAKPAKAAPADAKSGGKKPVWVEEEAHVILKEWAALTRISMVDVASQLVLENLRADGATEGLIGEVAAAAAPAPAPVAAPVAAAAEEWIGADEAPVPAAPAPVAAPAPAPAPAPMAARPERKREVIPTGDVQYLGGIWLV
jgi:hypothetical protein